MMWMNRVNVWLLFLMSYIFGIFLFKPNQAFKGHMLTNLFYEKRFSFLYMNNAITNTLIDISNATCIEWLERSPRKRAIVGSIPDRVIPKTLYKWYQILPC